LLSFVVPAHNEEALIGATLAALGRAIAAVGEPSEIIVVDDDSADRTAAIASAAGARAVQVKLRHIAAARNAGAAAARGDVLIFVDADTIVPEQTLREVILALSEGVVAGGVQARLDAHAPLWAKVCWRPFQYAGSILRLPGGAFMFMTRQAFESAGRFDEQYFAGEEIYFARTLKRIGPFRVLHHPVITSGRKFRVLGFRGTMREWTRLAAGGPGVLKTRKHLGFWYGTRREP